MRRLGGTCAAAAALLACAIAMTGEAAASDPVFASQATVADFGTATRPFGIAAADYDEDGSDDIVVGRTTGNVAFVKGNGDGTFQSPTVFAWKQAFFNGWAFASGDVNGDGDIDVVWGANATSTGCSISPIPTGETCASAGGQTITVNDGDVRVWYGNGDGTFQENTYFVSGVRHNAGTLIADIGTDAGSLAVADIDADSDADVVAGAVDGANTVVKILRNGGTSFLVDPTPVVSQPTSCTTPCSPVYFPAISTQNSPWGLAFGDADNDGDVDLWVGDRALYVYLFRNDGTGAWTMQTDNTAVSGRPNVYLGHDAFRAAVGFTASLGSGDLNADSKADLVLGLHSGTQTPASGTAHDGELLLDGSDATGHSLSGLVADIGTMARGVTVRDFDGDGARDIVASEYDGKVKLLRQLTPKDTDGDGISDYVDNAPNDANAPRIDMNTDGTINYQDQLDNDFDTVLGDPADETTWQRLGDVVDPDDDNDGVEDTADNCELVANGGQENDDGDGRGNACDPLDDVDADGDGVADGPDPGEPLFDESKAARAKWSTGDTHFVIRIDALGRFFQNEFTALMTDAATLSPEEWAVKCWDVYGPGDPADPCGTGEGTAEQTLTLPGGKEVPATTVVIPKQLWSDPDPVNWINDRNDNPRLEIGDHATYHNNNVPLGDWATLPDRDFFSCETCGLTFEESLELLKVGQDTLLGNYGNKWVAESGATPSSLKIDWSTSANPLISYAPPFNASDAAGRRGAAELGYRSFSASVFEEQSSIFTPEGSHHEQFDQYGMFHASADLELEPPDTTGDTYDTAAYENYLQSSTDDGGLTTWLIEEVEWSGRPCNNDDRLGTCNGGSNRENNTVYLPRWEGWMQLLDFVKNYPNGVVMTLGEVALAKGYDNAPTVANAGQADADHDGIGDVIDDAALNAADATLTRNRTGTLRATLQNGAGNPIPNQEVTFAFDADGDGNDEQYTDDTDAAGLAEVSVNATRDAGESTFTAAWDGGHGVTAADSGTVTVVEGATIVVVKNAVPDSAQDFEFTAGGGLEPTTFSLDDDTDPGLSNTRTFTDLEPRGGYSLSEQVPAGWFLTSASCDDGSPVSSIEVGPDETVTCTFVNTAGYPRPSGASPLRVSLVPAYRECTSPNRVHGPPLDHPSCNPPAQESSHLTVGTPDANGRMVNSVGSVRFAVRVGDPATPEDEADVNVAASLTDVRNTNLTLSDYTGELRAETSLRITDKYNGTAQNESATVTDVPLAFTIPCTATLNGSIGSSCSLDTSLDALMPGLVRERDRAVWAMGAVRLFDGGPDGDVDTAPNSLFATQGVFVP